MMRSSLITNFTFKVSLLCLIFQWSDQVVSQVLNPIQAGVIEGGFGTTPDLVGATSVYVKGNYAYVVGIGDALEIIDITLPGLPIHKGTLYNGQGGANIIRSQTVVVQGNYAYISSYGGNALEIVDVSDPAHPKHKSVLYDGGGVAPFLAGAWGLFVSGNYAYVGSASTYHLEIIDISDPAAPVHAGSVPACGLSVYVAGNYAYANCAGGLQVYDVSNPKTPVAVGTLNDGGGVAPFLGAGYSINVSGNYAYVTDLTNAAFEIVDVSNPGSPTHAGAIQNTGSGAPYLLGAWSVDVQGNFAYIIGSGRLEILDVTNPSNPVHQGGIVNGLFNQSRSIKVIGNYAYLVSRGSNSMSIIDVTNPASPTIKYNLQTGTGGPLIKNPGAVSVSGNYAYLTGGTGFEVVDISNPSEPVHKGSLGLGICYGLYVSGNYAYVAGSGTFFIVDITNPALPSLKGSLSGVINGAALSVVVSGAYAYLTCTNYGSSGAALEYLEIVDVSSISAPVHKGKITDGNGVAPFLNGANSVCVSGAYAYVSSNLSHALEIIDVSNPATPTHKSSLQDGGGNAPYLNGPMCVFISGNYAFLTSVGDYNYPLYNSIGTLEIVNISNPAAPVHAGGLNDGNGLPPTLTNANSIYVSQNYAYVGHGIGSTGALAGLEIIDISNPNNPLHYGQLQNTVEGAMIDFPTSVFVSGNYVYLANSGLSSDLDIVYLYGPAINGFSPSSGSVGTSITVTGQNFNTFSSPYINGTAATVATVSGTSATIIVPPGATNGKISFRYNGVDVMSSSAFVVTPTIKPPSSIQQTSFTATWSDVKASNYFLDVSTDGFSTSAGNYNGLNIGDVTNYVVTGLTPGTSYQYRIRSTDGVTISSNSNVVTAKTLAATPVAGAGSAFLQDGFTANWLVVSGTDGYFLDVASDASFTSILGSYNNLSVSSTSQIVSGLSAGTNYYYRVRSYNVSGSSPSSNVISVATIPSTPSTQTANQQTISGFTANWTASTGASNYYLDISMDNFTTFAPGYNNFSVAGNSYAATGLVAGTTYQYRVRAANASGTSGNSNVTSVLTLTPTPAAQPTNILFSNLTASSVNVSYTLASGSPDGYLVLRSPTAQPSTPPSNGTAYATGATLGTSSVAHVGPSLSFFDGGLPTGATYYYSIYSYNGSGAAVIYLTMSPLQGSVTLDVTPPVISAPANPNPSTITNGNTPTLNSIITDNVEVISAQIFYRGISQTDFKSAAMSPSGVGGNYSVQIQTNWYDSLGLEYYFSATDENGNTSAKPSETNFAQLINPSITLPALPSGGDQKSYRIVAFPYQLATDNKVTTVYNGVPWNDNTKAGMWWWNPGSNGNGHYDQYGASSTLQTVDVGKGYWMITSVPATPQLTNVAASKYNRANLYTMTLKPGWNEIGNPYPVAISWDDVITLNGKVNPNASFGSLSVFDGDGYVTATGSRLLKPFEGGFVKNLGSSDVSIQIPFVGQTSIGGRAGGMTSDLSSTAWRVFLNVAQDGFINRLGGFGMNLLATAGADRYDNYCPPKFLNMPEVIFSKTKDLQQTVCADVIDLRDEYTWHFSVAGSEGAETELSWTPQLQTGFKQLYLLDESTMSLIDMTSVNRYSFAASSKNKFSIYFGKDVQSQLSCQNIGASTAYPNPLTAENKVSFNIGLPENDMYKVEVTVVNVQGEIVGATARNLPPGYQTVDLAFNGSLPSGIYFYKLAVASNESSQVFSGKIVKP